MLDHSAASTPDQQDALPSCVEFLAPPNIDRANLTVADQNLPPKQFLQNVYKFWICLVHLSRMYNMHPVANFFKAFFWLFDLIRKARSSVNKWSVIQYRRIETFEKTRNTHFPTVMRRRSDVAASLITTRRDLISTWKIHDGSTW